MIALCAGFLTAVCVFVAADNVSGTPWAFPFAVLIVVACCVLAWVDGERR